MTSPTQQIRDSTIGQVVPIWLFAIGWNLFLVGFIWFVRQRIDWPASAILFFLLAGGLVPLSIAVYLTMIEMRYGRSVFELRPLLCVPGGVVTGTIRIPRPVTPQDGIHLRLACFSGAIWRHAGSPGDSKVEVDSVVWEELSTLDRISPGAAVSQIPVYFRIPPDARASDNSKVGEQLVWRLEAKAKTGGVHYAASFLLPVFAGQVPPEIHGVGDPTAAMRSPEPARRQLMDRHIHLTALPDGGCQCELARGRTVGMTMFLAVLGTVFIGASLFIFSQSTRGTDFMDVIFRVAYIPFGAVFFAAGTFVVVVAVSMFLDRVTITVRHGLLTVKNTVVVLGRQRALPAADIKDIVIDIDGQIGTRATYCVNATRSQAKPLKLCGWIGDKRDAEWLAAEFKRELWADAALVT